ncbi:hypothetical protein LIER_37922 [Lithospermum erythrorhizon]|uniref:Uncharacterized protein n=1 Tax=Lithospermum erythrorhizon TaxID=34254 RepID=A0AAV3PTY1_LITER
MMNSSTNLLEKVLETRKEGGDNSGIGYEKGGFNGQREEQAPSKARSNQGDRQYSRLTPSRLSAETVDQEPENRLAGLGYQTKMGIY